MLFICLLLFQFILLCVITKLFLTRDQEIVTINIEQVSLSFHQFEPVYEQTESDSSDGYPSTDSLSNYKWISFIPRIITMKI